MVASIEAVYEAGRLRPLEPVALSEGQRVRITILPDEPPRAEGNELTPDEVAARLRAAGLLAEIKAPPGARELPPAERRRIGALFVGDRPSHELIDEDRGEY